MQRYEEWSLRDFQLAIEQVKKQCFAEYPKAIYDPTARALNVAEEAGELAREERLFLEGIQTDLSDAEDAVGDVLMALLGYCIAREWDAQAILETVFSELKKRWQSGQLAGIPGKEQ